MRCVTTTPQQCAAAARAYIEPRVGGGHDATNCGFAVGDGWTGLKHELIDVLRSAVVISVLRSVLVERNAMARDKP